MSDVDLKLQTNVSNLIFRFLDTNGDGTGSKEAIGNYSDGGLGATDFFFNCDHPQGCLIHDLIIFIEDSGGVISAEDYGNLGTLTNGYLIEVKDAADSVLLDYTDGLPIRENAHLERIALDAELTAWGTGNSTLVSRISFDRSGQPLFLRNGDKIVVTLNDSMVGLISHNFRVRGTKLYDRMYK